MVFMRLNFNVFIRNKGFYQLLILIWSLNSLVNFAFAAKRNSTNNDVLSGHYLLSRMQIDLGKLNLSPEQKATIIKCREMNLQQMLVLKKNYTEQKAKIKHDMFSITASNENIKSDFKDLINTKNQMDNLILLDFLNVRQVLNKSQKLALAKNMGGNQD